MTFFEFLGWASGISVVASCLFSWLFKIGVEKAIDRGLQRDFESYKNALLRDSAQQLERLKFDLQSKAQEQLEHLRSELAARNEVIRGEIQKQMLRAQLTTTKTHEVYAQLLKLLRIADGAVGRLWGSIRHEQTYEKHSAGDIRRILKEAKTPGEEVREIRELLRTDRKGALALLRVVLRRKEEHDARAAVRDANNYIFLEALFMTVSVRDLAFKVCTSLDGANNAVHVGTMDRTSPKYSEAYNRHIEQSTKDIGLLEEMMRAELHPVPVNPPAQVLAISLHSKPSSPTVPPGSSGA